MIDTRSALLAAIRAKPDDDTPRLVYADYIDEQGEEDRAAFIRFQCDPRNQGTHNGEWEYAVAEQHVDEWFWLSVISGRKRNRKSHDWYFADHGPPNLRFRWGRRDEYGQSVWVELPIRRGFFESAECPSAWWLAHGDAILRAHPVRTVRLTDRWTFYSFRSGIDDFLTRRWPGVRFELPAERMTVEEARRIRDEARASMERAERITAELIAGTPPIGSHRDR